MAAAEKLESATQFLSYLKHAPGTWVILILIDFLSQSSAKDLMAIAPSPDDSRCAVGL